MLQWFHKPLLYCSKKLSGTCAQYPCITVTLSSVIAISILSIGYTIGFDSIALYPIQKKPNTTIQVLDTRQTKTLIIMLYLGDSLQLLSYWPSLLL
jgi:hypothetical protein